MTTVFDGDAPGMFPLSSANARLIASAPELLVALKMAQYVLQQVDTGDAAVALDSATKAIGKAT